MRPDGRPPRAKSRGFRLASNYIDREDLSLRIANLFQVAARQFGRLEPAEL